jgi:hypothetical protein
VTDIPMNRKAAAARALYDVPLLCRRLPGAPPALAALVAAGADAGPGSGPAPAAAALPEAAPGGEPLVLRWVKAPRGFRPAARACSSASRALPEATECARAPALRSGKARAPPRCARRRSHAAPDVSGAARGNADCAQLNQSTERSRRDAALLCAAESDACQSWTACIDTPVQI